MFHANRADVSRQVKRAKQAAGRCTRERDAARCSLSDAARRLLRSNGGRSTFVRLRVLAERREVSREDLGVGDFPTVDDLLHRFIVKVEVMPVDGREARIPIIRTTLRRWLASRPRCATSDAPVCRKLRNLAFLPLSL